MKTTRILTVLFGLLIVIGIIFRFYHITDNDFVFYDEGYYLNWNRPLGEAITNHPLQNFEVFTKAFHAYVSRSLASGKTLWFMLVDARFFFGGFEQWYISRLWAAILGILTLALTYLFAKKYFNSSKLAIFATALLAILPSHVFYSRIGMQESLSTLLVLAGFYFYLFPAKFSGRALLAGLCWGLAFFSNYRLIMLPVLITCAEIFLAISLRRSPDFRKWLWSLLMFTACVFILGNYNGGENTVVIFSWIFHQASMAGGQLDWMNIFSYPYYLFRLETFFFALFFLTGFYLIIRREFKLLLPFVLVLVQMGVFTFASEKGARYVGVVLPFMAMTVAYIIYELLARSKNQYFRKAVILCSSIMVAMMLYKSFQLVVSHSDYRSSVENIYQLDSQAKFLSSQNYVQKLYQNKPNAVRQIPANFEILVNDYKSGYRYLVLCPQAYISLTESKDRFDPQLRSYLGFIINRFPPQRTYSHFSPVLLDRFVLEHNENLMRSIRFLNQAEKRNFGVLRVYDLSEILTPMLNAAAKAKERQP